MPPCGMGSYHKVAELYFSFIYIIKLYKKIVQSCMLGCQAVALHSTEQIHGLPYK